MKKEEKSINVMKVVPLVNHLMFVQVVLYHIDWVMENVTNVTLNRVNISIILRRNVRIVVLYVKLVIMVHLVLLVRVKIEIQKISVNVLKAMNKMVLIVRNHSQVNQLKLLHLVFSQALKTTLMVQS